MYTVEMRIRGNRVRVYSGASYTLRFTASISGFSGGYAGYRSDNHTVCELMRLGDAWTYEPYERFDVRMPDGSFKSFGRISRSSAAWDEEFQVFTLTADVEESSTRSEDISMDYDFLHSDLMDQGGKSRAAGRDERGGGADTAVHQRERPRGARPDRIPGEVQ